MLGFRTLTYLTLATTAIVGTIDHRPGIISGVRSGFSQDAAWALLAEADEFCRVGSATGPAAGSVPRLAVAEEALEIVRELANAIDDAAVRTPLLGAAERLDRRCRESSAPSHLSKRSLASLDGSGRHERDALLAIYLERLNDAASRAIEHDRNQVASSAKAPVPALASSAPGAEPEAGGSDRSGPVSGVKKPHPEQHPLPGADLEPEPPRIVIGTSTQKHRDRVARWSLVFEREAGVLRTSRRELQLEIDSYSLAQARSACRNFGSSLAHLDSEFAEGAPSRELSLRIARMVARYRRGAAACVAGRPTGAFAHLSEGDREWELVAQRAAPMFRPRPMRPIQGVDSAVSAPTR